MELDEYQVGPDLNFFRLFACECLRAWWKRLLLRTKQLFFQVWRKCVCGTKPEGFDEDFGAGFHDSSLHDRSLNRVSLLGWKTGLILQIAKPDISNCCVVKLSMLIP